MNRTSSSQTAGLSVIEVLVALAILGIVTAAILTTFLGSIRTNSDSGRRTQSVQIMNAIGRRVAGADPVVLAQPGTPIVWGYGGLTADFPEFRGDGISDPDLYRVVVTNLGAVTLGSASVVHYSVETCSRSAGGDETCVRGDTAGVPPGPEDDAPTGLDGIN